MSDVVVMDVHAAEDAEGWAAPTCSLAGGGRSTMHGPEGFSLWLVTGTLEPGAELRWEAGHGDEVVFVRAGALEHDGRRLDAGWAAIVESGATAALRAAEATTLVHFGPTSAEAPADGVLGPPAAGGHDVHVVPAGGTHGKVFEGDGGRIDTRFYADSTCETCRLTLLRNRAGTPFRANSHSHSEDEIIYLLEGDMQVGPLNLGPDMAIAIPKDRRYGFRSQGGFDFINYRRDASTYRQAPGSDPTLETAATYAMEPVPAQG